MAYSSFLISLFLVSLLSFGLSLARPSTKLATPNDFINDVCVLARDYNLCIQVLRSDPKAPKFDFKGLGQISIGIAQNNAKQTSNLITYLSTKTTNPNAIARYITCANDYADAIDNLIQTRAALNSGDINLYKIKAVAALNGADNCEYTWQGSPEELPQLKQANAKAEGIISIVVAVGEKLT